MIDPVDIVGWIGAGMILMAYSLLSMGKVVARGVPYQLLNIGGATGLLTNAWVREAWPLVGLNLVWIGIGIYVLATRRRAA
ncbi:MAG: hypothetical protein CVT77_16530 [Alphaproteobacteria bacterium HGW-Alphaproteobacteria-16]|nr:MAG: hypothetical protein CVT77_16530 [Alphaproteobacteria bacterium HGW-Alphaproteobacteria-16]